MYDLTDLAQTPPNWPSNLTYTNQVIWTNAPNLQDKFKYGSEKRQFGKLSYDQINNELCLVANSDIVQGEWMNEYTGHVVSDVSNPSYCTFLFKFDDIMLFIDSTVVGSPMRYIRRTRNKDLGNVIFHRFLNIINKN